jgi:cysteine synthase A
LAIAENILGLVGKTPLVRLNRLPGPDCAEVYAKLEFFNPGYSVKDRIGVAMIEAAEKEGKLKAGSTMVEPTSGNTGIALAIAAAVKGYRMVLTMPESMSVERRKLLVHLGSEIVLTPASEGMSGAVKMAQKLAKDNGWFMPQQFENRANPDIHFKTTGPEIYKDLSSVKKKCDFLVAGVGTGGTISGAGKFLKSKWPSCRLVAVEPAESPVLSGGMPGPHKIQGIGAGFVPVVYDSKIIDSVATVDSDSAMKMARELSRKEGIICGVSSGANCAIALDVAKKAGKGKTVVVILPDTGERYISTPLFEEQ